MKTNVAAIGAGYHRAWYRWPTKRDVLKIFLLINARKIIEQGKLVMAATRTWQTCSARLQFFDDALFNIAHCGTFWMANAGCGSSPNSLDG
jgi:hypothetical protein